MTKRPLTVEERISLLAFRDSFQQTARRHAAQAYVHGAADADNHDLIVEHHVLEMLHEIRRFLAANELDLPDIRAVFERISFDAFHDRLDQLQADDEAEREIG